MDSTPVHSHFDTPQSAITNKHKGTTYIYGIQRRAWGAQARIIGSEQGTDSKALTTADNGVNEYSKTDAQNAGTDKTQNGTGVPNGGVTPAGQDTAAKDTTTEGGEKEAEKKKGSVETDREDTTNKKPSKDVNAKEKPVADVSATESTTTVPVAEGDPTAGGSNSTSTSTHSPTETVRGADDQASVKAGVLSFILSVGILHAIFV